MSLRPDFSSSFNNPGDADVLLHLTTCSSTKKHKHQQHDRTYYAHAMFLKSMSEYFKTCMSSDWQQQQQQQQKQKQQQSAKRQKSDTATPSPATPPMPVRYELVEHVKAEDLDAMEQLLRLMYSQNVPADTPVQVVLQMLLLADRYQAENCTKLLIAHIAAGSKEAITGSVALQLCSMPPGIQQRPAFQKMLLACAGSIVSLFRNVPAVIENIKQREQFCALPFMAVLKWVLSDQLQVHSENCVVYLLSAWVAAQDKQPAGQGVSAKQLELLAHQVRVLHLGPTFHYFVLPNLSWFKGCSGMTHLPLLLAHKGVYRGVSVFPSPSRGRKADKSWAWGGPAAWVAAPREKRSATPTLSWELGPSELQQLSDGQTVSCRSPLYCNGVLFQGSLSKRTQEGSGRRVTLGMFFSVSHQLMSQHGVQLAHQASVSVGEAKLKVNAPAANHAQTLTMTKTRFTMKGQEWGWSDVLEWSAATFQGLVAPMLVNGKLRVEMSVSGVDLPA